MRDVQNPIGGRDRRKEDAEELAEGHADSGDGSGLNDQVHRPAVEESPERAERFAQVNILAAGVRHHGGQFSVGERAGDGHESGHHPGGDQQRGRIDQAGDFGGDDEDAGADHRAHDQRGGAGQAQTFHEFVFAGDERYGFRFSSQGASNLMERTARQITPTAARIPLQLWLGS